MEFKFPDKQEVNNATSSVLGVQHEIQRHLDEAKSKLLTGDPSLACVALDVMERHFVEVKGYAQKALECLNRAQQVGEVIANPLNQLAVLRQRIEQATAEHQAALQRYREEFEAYKASIAQAKADLAKDLEAERQACHDAIDELKRQVEQESRALGQAKAEHREFTAYVERLATESSALSERAEVLWQQYRDCLRRQVEGQAVNEEEVERVSAELRAVLAYLPKSHRMWREIQAMSEPVE
jgi:chromosome segregation ATPase